VDTPMTVSRSQYYGYIFDKLGRR